MRKTAKHLYRESRRGAGGGKWTGQPLFSSGGARTVSSGSRPSHTCTNIYRHPRAYSLYYSVPHQYTHLTLVACYFISWVRRKDSNYGFLQQKCTMKNSINPFVHFLFWLILIGVKGELDPIPADFGQAVHPGMGACHLQNTPCTVFILKHLR